MFMLLRQILAILVLPCTMAVVIPVWLARRENIRFTRPDDPGEVLFLLLGSCAFGVGLALFVSSVLYFWSRGRGTLAPWDPPRHLVVEGPYRVVRNPMISGVLFVLLGQAAILRSMPHARWAGLFALINAIYIPLLEEPMLRMQFGESYDRYAREVGRFIPRFRPWKPGGTNRPPQ